MLSSIISRSRPMTLFAAATEGLPRCVVIATGGTVAMRPDPRSGAPVPALSGEELVASVPQLLGLARLDVRSVFNVPSVEMGPARWLALRQALLAALDDDEVCGIVVTHGTDLLEETAWFLALTLPAECPVVLTGAMRHAAESQFDGPRNLLDAVRVAISPSARGMGVLVVMDGEVYCAREAEKSHTTETSAFRRGPGIELGAIGAEGPAFWRKPRPHPRIEPAGGDMPRVDIVPMFGGADGLPIRWAVQSGARGVVVQAVGAGNVSAAMYTELLNALEAGVMVVVATRVRGGRSQPVYGFLGGGTLLAQAGAIFSGGLSPQKARILLMLALQPRWSTAQVRELFDF
ncbi:MAG TPA: asparaginase [Burkholderiaceae bacterium]